MNEQENQISEMLEEEAPKKRRGGRRPKSETAQAAPVEKPQTIFVQFQGSEVDVDTLVEKATAAFREEKKRTKINTLKLYIKPEERAAYFVINEKFDGKVEY